MQFYPNNTITQYKTKLQTTIELTGEWEVALAEMTFPKSWFTIPKHGAKFAFTCQLDPIDAQSIPDFLKNINFPPLEQEVELEISGGYYKTIHDIVSQMNHAITRILSDRLSYPIFNEKGDHVYKPLDEEKWPKMKYSEVNRKATVVLHPETSMKFDNYLAIVLGYGNNPIINRNEESRAIDGSNVSDLYGGIHNVYVYTDVIEHIPVGDTEAPLLTIVETPGKYGDVIQKSFKPLRYMRVQKTCFDTIEIDIRNVFGESVPFKSGIVVVMLHFRRALSPYFL